MTYLFKVIIHKSYKYYKLTYLISINNFVMHAQNNEYPC